MNLFFVGYQAKGTPGRAMMGKKVPVKAAIHILTGYSLMPIKICWSTG